MNARRLPDYDEGDLDLWLDLPDEAALRVLVRDMTAACGLVATERRWFADRLVVRARSVRLQPTGEPVAARCWQRHVDHDLWAEREWPALPGDAEPLEDVGGVEEGRCWLHELALAACGCPTMAEALRPSPWGAVTGEPEAANPFARSPDAARMVLPVVWRTSCPACRANTRETDEEPGLVCPECGHARVCVPGKWSALVSRKPGLVCPECGHARVCWRCGIDREPRVEWAPRPEPTYKEGSVELAADAGAANTATPVQPVATVAAGQYMRAEWPLEASSPPSVSEAPPLAPSPAAGGAAPAGPLAQPTPAVVALVAQAAANVEARGAPAAKRRNHRWEVRLDPIGQRPAEICKHCGVRRGKSAPPCAGGAE